MFEKGCKYYVILYQDYPKNLINSKIYRRFHLMLKYKNKKYFDGILLYLLLEINEVVDKLFDMYHQLRLLTVK